SAESRQLGEREGLGLDDPTGPDTRARTSAGLEEPDAQGRRFRPGTAGHPAVRDRPSPGRTSADHLSAHGTGLHCPEPDFRALTVGAAAAEGRNGFRALLPRASG